MAPPEPGPPFPAPPAGGPSSREAAPAIPTRKHPIHLTPDESDYRPIIIFLTLCTKGRRPLLAKPEIHSALVSAWNRAAHWLIGRYVIMPDHLHLFCSPGVLPPHPFKLWMAYWQNLVTREWPHTDEKPVWQKDYWDRQLRTGDSYDEKWGYVCNNPVRHKLASSSGAWPYQGELNVLQWHRR